MDACLAPGWRTCRSRSRASGWSPSSPASSFFLPLARRIIRPHHVQKWHRLTVGLAHGCSPGGRSRNRRWYSAVRPNSVLSLLDLGSPEGSPQRRVPRPAASARCASPLEFDWAVPRLQSPSIGRLPRTRADAIGGTSAARAARAARARLSLRWSERKRVALVFI